ncbi:biotin/lipoyl-binding protein, partial [Achromobacter aegrifaciens]|uniref:biotin/lipoyl-binding protein n=1 Tax=Achromobacter aegrifaciens TaxID=1287736 RepID=UPI000F748821
MRIPPALRRPLPASALALLALGGCGKDDGAFFQGYAEGEYVYVASSEAGRLAELPVRRGQQVQADAPLFALEAPRATPARAPARARVAARGAAGGGRRPRERG